VTAVLVPAARLTVPGGGGPWGVAELLEHAETRTFSAGRVGVGGRRLIRTRRRPRRALGDEVRRRSMAGSGRGGCSLLCGRTHGGEAIARTAVTRRPAAARGTMMPFTHTEVRVQGAPCSAWWPGAAARRPELVGSLIAHEPPGSATVSWVAMRNSSRCCAPSGRSCRQWRASSAPATPGAARAVRRGGHARSRLWDKLPEELRQTMVDNAPTFLATMADPRWADLGCRGAVTAAGAAAADRGDQNPTGLRGHRGRAGPSGRRGRPQAATHLRRRRSRAAADAPEQYVQTVRASWPPDRPRPARMPR